MHNNELEPELRRGILLVEDVAAMRLYVKMLLENAGFEVIEASTLDQARQCLRRGLRPASVLLDLDLPDGHGLDIMGEIPSGTPVIALSADVADEVTLQCRRAGCADVVSKDGSLEQLARILSTHDRDVAAKQSVTAREADLATQYKAYLQQTRAELEQAFLFRDYEAIRRIAHRLRGTAIHFGYSDIGENASAVGPAISRGRSQAEPVLQELLERLRRVTEARRAL